MRYQPLLFSLILVSACASNDDSHQVGLRSEPIVGGEPVAEDAYPWFVRLFIEYEGQSYDICGGSLIDSTHVLTAGHCAVESEEDDELHTVVEQPRAAEPYSVVVRPQSIEAVTPEDKIAVTRLWVSPEFADNLTGTLHDAVDGDLAILELEHAVDVETFPRLAREEQTAALIEREVFVRTIGNGVTDPYGEEQSDVTNQVDVRLVSNEACAAQYEGQAPITDGMLCAGWSEGGRDSCGGDSGGPIFARRRSPSPLLLGIVSWGTEVVRPEIIPCGSPDYASVYTNIAHYHDYITDCLAGSCATLQPTQYCADGYADQDGSPDNGCEAVLPAKAALE